MDKKRVWALYRVSDKSQVHADEDIPMQREACRRFVAIHPDWTLENELYEKGVSGWKKKSDDRDELVRIKNAAVENKFDILVIFMSDRLGRKKDETPFILEFLKTNNVDVYSVKEGLLKSEDHVDALINYIRFWQAEGESLKTSVRVREEMYRLNLLGYYVGGNMPFGYELIQTDKMHPKNKDKFLKKQVIKENDARVVKLMFELSAYRNYGRHRIAAYLNERGYVNHYGKKFTDKFVNRVLTNPIYKGRKRYSFTNEDGIRDTALQDYNPELDIVGEELFDLSMKRIGERKEKLKNENEQYHDGTPNASKVLLSGLIVCGYCGKKMKTDYSYKDYKRKSDGKITRMITYRYRCANGKNNVVPHEKQQVGAKTIDQMVEEYVIEFIQKIDLDALKEKVLSGKAERTEQLQEEIDALSKKIDKKKREQLKLTEEIPKALMGESSFSPDVLSSALEQVKSDIEILSNSLEKMNHRLMESQLKTEEAENVERMLDGWIDRYKNADLDVKKVMVSDIINKVTWTKDSIDVDINLISRFIN
ncbi:recombinase family protein [Halalkalibacterium halodurans]|uniref:recombinase family protein n=1 Tax=Halalkalibacterium halodurans TaxID=86665 RepID=UPI002AAA50AD|nr:recombinase family protein [Halalkalibacterium halodurans]MDY7222121.1 recombinase family protein [Halalkalibacterium halodurans]MDY7243921.1 recombinase family protein [Halalkalibacterium halodurans]